MARPPPPRPCASPSRPRPDPDAGHGPGGHGPGAGLRRLSHRQRTSAADRHRRPHRAVAPRLRSALLAIPALLAGACASDRGGDAAALRRAFADARTGLLPTATAYARPEQAPMPASLPAVSRGLPAAAVSRPMVAAQLLGARPEMVRRWWGEPALRRIEGLAEIWRYDGPACALDLLLYPEPGGLRVAHAAARASGIEMRTEAACLGGLGQSQGQAGSPFPARDRAAPEARRVDGG